MSLTRLIKISGFFCALSVGAACGGDGKSSADAAVDEADAAGTPDFTGQTLILEMKFVDQPDMLGELLFIGPKYQAIEDVVPPVYEESPGSPFGCKVWERTPDEYTDPGLDVGTIEYTFSDGPEVPPCTFVPNQGYRCIDVMSDAGDIAVVDSAGGIYSLTDNSATLGDVQVGRALNLTSDVTPLNGLFPIVGAMGDNTVHFQGPPGLDMGTTGTASNYMTIAALPLPAGATDPIADGSTVSISLTPGEEPVFSEFSFDNLMIGGSFTEDTPSLAILDNFPMDGEAMTVGCAGEGGECGAGMATIFAIATTDAEIPEMAPPFAFPKGMTKQVEMICIALSGTVNVPAEASQLVADSGATRIRAGIARVFSRQEITSEVNLGFAIGHMRAGFTDIE